MVIETHYVYHSPLSIPLWFCDGSLPESLLVLHSVSSISSSGLPPSFRPVSAQWSWFWCDGSSTEQKSLRGFIYWDYCVGTDASRYGCDCNPNKEQCLGYVLLFITGYYLLLLRLSLRVLYHVHSCCRDLLKNKDETKITLRQWRKQNTTCLSQLVK